SRPDGVLAEGRDLPRRDDKADVRRHPEAARRQVTCRGGLVIGPAPRAPHGPNSAGFTSPPPSGTVRPKASRTTRAGSTPRASSRLAARSGGVTGASAGYAAR